MRKLLLYVAGGVVCVGLLLSSASSSRPKPLPAAEPCQLPVRDDSHGEQVNVVVARVNIPRQRKLRADVLSVIQVPPSLRNTDAATSVRQVLDWYPMVNIFAKEQILLKRLAPGLSAGGGIADSVARGHRAVSIPMTADRAAGGYVAPGKLVDVICSLKTPWGLITKPLLRRKRVLAVTEKQALACSLGGPVQRGSSSPGGNRPHMVQAFSRFPELQAVTLEVASGEAEKLVLAASSTTLYLVIVNSDGLRDGECLVTEQWARAISDSGTKQSPAGTPAGDPIPPARNSGTSPRHDARSAVPSPAMAPTEHSSADLPIRVDASGGHPR